jgi:hypothetical protein
VYDSHDDTRIYEHLIRLDGETCSEICVASYEPSTFFKPCCGMDFYYYNCQFNGQDVTEDEMFRLFKEACGTGSTEQVIDKFIGTYSYELSLPCHEEENLNYGRYDLDMVGSSGSLYFNPDHTISSTGSDDVLTWAMRKYPDYDPDTDSIVNRYIIIANRDGGVYAFDGNRMIYCCWAVYPVVYEYAE